MLGSSVGRSNRWCRCALVGFTLVGLGCSSEHASPAQTSAATDGREALAVLTSLYAGLGMDPPKESGSSRADMLRAYDDLVRYLEPEAGDERSSLDKIPSISPVRGGRITSPFGPRRIHPVHGDLRPHLGLDIAAPQGTPILATARGVVTVTHRHPGYGKVVDLFHAPTPALHFVTRYAHASEILVASGQRVERGDTIARVGATGTATGPHVHYEVFRNGRRIDPIHFLLDSNVAMTHRVDW